MRCRLIALVVGSIAIATTSSAQQAATPGLAFDVVSIKPNPSGVDSIIRVSPGRIEFPSTTLMGLIKSAYGRFAFDPREVVGGPSWIDSDRFRVIGTSARPFQSAPDGFPTDLSAMIRRLVEDRFKVRVHSEQRETAHYAMILARTDGKTGPGLRSAPDECTQAIKELSGAKPAPRTRAGPPPCSFGGPPGKIVGTGVTLNAFANMLSRFAGRRVIDRTGLPGSFDIELTFDPASAAQLPPGAAPGPLPRDDAAASIFTALQEQLGLKLESTRSPVDVLVVDAAEPPTPD